RFQHRFHDGFVDLPDGPDAEARTLRQLARIDRETASPKRFIELLKIEIGVARRVESLDDRPGRCVIEKGGESESPHAVDQHAGIAPIAAAAAFDAALFLMLVERLVEGDERMGRWREAELPVLFKAFPLLVQIEHHRMAFAEASL